MNNTVLKNLIISKITGIIHACLGVLLFYFEPVTKLIDFFASDYISIELYVELILLIATFVIVMHKLGFEKNFYMSLVFLFFSGAVSLILTNGIANLLSNPFDRLGCLVILIGVVFCAAINACLMLLIYLYTVLRRKLSK